MEEIHDAINDIRGALDGDATLADSDRARLDSYLARLAIYAGDERVGGGGTIQERLLVANASYQALQYRVGGIVEILDQPRYDRMPGLPLIRKSLIRIMLTIETPDIRDSGISLLGE